MSRKSCKQRNQSDGVVAVLSYIPGVYTEVVNCYGPDQGYIQAKLGLATPVYVDYVMWFADANGMMAPTFVLRDATRIYEHLLWWAGNVPAQWFSLVAVDIPRGYIITLWPDVVKIRDRAKSGALAVSGAALSKDAKFRVFTVPLRFTGRHSSNWDAAKSRLGATTSVGFLDTSKVDLQNAPNTDFSAVLWVEGIPVATDENVKKFVKHREDLTLVIYTIDM